MYKVFTNPRLIITILGLAKILTWWHCQIQCNDSVFPLSFLQHNCFSQLLFDLLARRQRYLKKCCWTFEDTCGPAGFSPVINFILDGVLLDSSQAVHFKLLESCGASLSLLDSLSIIVIFWFLVPNIVPLTPSLFLFSLSIILLWIQSISFLNSSTSNSSSSVLLRRVRWSVRRSGRQGPRTVIQTLNKPKEPP